MNMRKIVIRLQEVDSTNSYLRRMALPEGADMLVAVADHQTAGRGQGSNTWESEPGSNLLFSLSLRPEALSVERRFVLSMAGALALKDVLDGYGLGVTLKWPNDIYWRDSKISGTLIETTVCGHFIKDCIWGVGINVNQRVFHSDAPNPVSMYHILGHETPPDELLAGVLEAFERRYMQAVGGEYERLAAEYRSSLYRRNGFHAFRDGNGRFMAEILGVEPDGRLVLRDEQGNERKYMFKEINYIISE